MNDQEFWKLIDLLDWSKLGDDDAVLKPLVDKLASLSERDICDFDDLLAEKLYALDGEKYAREIGDEAYEDEEYFSPDFFLYARCCAVIDGKNAYEAVLADPSKMPKNKEFEAILYAAQTTFEKKTGRKYTHIPKPDYETYSNEEGWE